MPLAVLCERSLTYRYPIAGNREFLLFIISWSCRIRGVRWQGEVCHGSGEDWSGGDSGNSDGGVVSGRTDTFCEDVDQVGFSYVATSDDAGTSVIRVPTCLHTLCVVYESDYHEIRPVYVSHRERLAQVKVRELDVEMQIRLLTNELSGQAGCPAHYWWECCPVVHHEERRTCVDLLDAQVPMSPRSIGITWTMTITMPSLHAHGCWIARLSDYSGMIVLS